VTVRSYYGVVVADTGVYLLGGGQSCVSSRFAKKCDAEYWVDLMIVANREAGRGCAGSVRPSSKAPEIRGTQEETDAKS
jgi:hypothetical protein